MFCEHDARYKTGQRDDGQGTVTNIVTLPYGLPEFKRRSERFFEKTKNKLLDIIQPAEESGYPPGKWFFSPNALHAVFTYFHPGTPESATYLIILLYQMTLVISANDKDHHGPIRSQRLPYKSSKTATVP